MNRITIISAIILLSSFFTPEGLFGQKKEKRLNDQFPVKSSDILEIDSKFGNINLLSDGDENISIEAVLWVSSDDEGLAAEILDKLSVETYKEGNRIVIASVTPDRMPSRKNTKFAIDYNIHAPSDINLELRNSYGNVYIEELEGHASVSLSYGNLRITELTRGNEKPLNEISLSYSNGSIEEAGWIKADLAYSKLRIEEAEAVLAVSSYSGMSIDECSSLVSESKYDTYTISELNNYVGELKFGNLSIDELMNKLDVTSSFSTVKVQEVDSGFETIKIDNSRGSAKLVIDDNASFTFTGEAIRGDISVSGMDNLNKRVENADRYLDGSHGNNPGSKVDVHVMEGSVKISLE